MAEPDHEEAVGAALRLEGAGEDAEAALIDQGHEGVILRTLNGVYKHGRSGKTGPLLKVKRFVERARAAAPVPYLPDDERLVYDWSDE